MMNWINKNWGWITSSLSDYFPDKIMSMIHIDFSASAESWISMDTFTMREDNRENCPGSFRRPSGR
jgi:hypothetical protein